MIDEIVSVEAFVHANHLPPLLPAPAPAPPAATGGLGQNDQRDELMAQMPPRPSLQMAPGPILNHAQGSEILAEMNGLEVPNALHDFWYAPTHELAPGAMQVAAFLPAMSGAMHGLLYAVAMGALPLAKDENDGTFTRMAYK